MASAPVPEQPLETVTARQSNLDAADLGVIVKNQEESQRFMWSLVIMYAVMLLVFLLVSFFVLRRVTTIQETFLENAAKKAGDFAKNTSFLPKLVKAGTELVTASVDRATEKIRADGFQQQRRNAPARRKNK